MRSKFILIAAFFQFAFSYSIYAESSEKWISAEPATREILITGFTRAHATIPVVTETAGKINKIFANIGEPIPSQGKLACLDDIFVRLDIQDADNEIARHTNDISYFKKEVSRHDKLVAKQTAAVSVLDGLKRDLINAQRAMQAANIRKQRLNELKRRHCVEAPAGWLVIDRSIEAGQWVNEGEIIAHIGDYSELIVPVTLTGQELEVLKKGKFEVLLADYSLKVPAVIKHISPAFDDNSRKIPVDLSLKEGLPEYRGGLRVDLSLELPSNNQAFVVTEQALEQRFEEYWLHRKDGHSIRVNLLSRQKNGKVNIISPEIKAGDKFKIIRE